MINNIKSYLLGFPFIKGLNRLRFQSLELVYKPEDLNGEYYKKALASKDKELEHHIGRLINFKKIIGEIDRDKLDGDVLEFGTWQGFSLQWIAYLLERAGIFDKKIIGVDGFVGLPNTEGIFMKGTFSNTAQDLVRKNIKFSSNLYQKTRENCYIEKFLYSEDQAILKRLRHITDKRFCFIHIDCDISSSVSEIFTILTYGDLLADKCFLLFDDYGLMKSYADSVDGLLKSLEERWSVTEHSKTALTRNVMLTKL